MKILCEVDSPNQVAVENKDSLFIVSSNDTRDLQEALSAKTDKAFLFISSEVDVSFLLKLVEDFQGDLVCYVAGVYSEVFASRFTALVSKREYALEKTFPEYSPVEKLFRETQKLVCKR